MLAFCSYKKSEEGVKMTSLKEKMKANQKIVKWAVGGVVITIVIGALTWAGNIKNAYAVVVDGNVVAVAQTKEEISSAYEQVIATLKSNAGVDIAVNEQVQCEAIHSKKSDLEDFDELVEALSASITYNVEAYEILVNGTSYAVVSSEAEANEILTQIASSYLPREGNVTLSQAEVATVKADVSKQENDTTTAAEVLEVAEALPQAEVANVISVGNFEVAEEEPQGEGQKIKRSVEQFDFNEEVVIRNVYVDSNQILDASSAQEKLLSPKYEETEYTLVDGDNVWDIAMQYNTTMEKIMALNPEIEDETKMQIGQVIKVEKATPILSITTVEEATYKQIIPADIQYVVFSNLYQGQTQVYQAGNDGLKEVTVSVTKVNGEEVSRELVSENVLSEPKITVIGYGVKEKPVADTVISGGSGSFAHPLKGAGSISSTYGARWGTFHKGMDFAASAGTPIYAAASGKVIYSGYNSGGYGNLIIIEHSNGYQTYYAHCSRLYANVGDTVSTGERIAGVGSTGDSTGNHLHFEVRKNGNPVNPANYL